MRHKLRRAARIWRTRGPRVLAEKAAGYVPIEVDNLFYRFRQESPTRVMDEDWDSLVILDACRHDMFEDRNTLEGTLEHRFSLGSTSEEFLERNFTDETYHDTVYVNANPYVPYLGLDAGTFHAVVDLLDEWDDDLQTVLPETVVEAALEAHQRYPKKRLIVHFMQPHAPFIGTRGRELGMGGWNPDQENEGLDGDTVWQYLRQHPPESEAGINLDRVWEAYTENLDLVLEHVKELIDELDGTTVVTADHGNLVGERLSPIPTKRFYGHPYGVYHPNLVKVPWLRVGGDERREIVTEPPRSTDTVDEDVTEERLEALGYK